jgi:hypothetical protein
MQYRVLLFSLAGCFPAVFFAAHNWYSFTAAQVLVLIAVPTFGSVIVLGLGNWIVCRLIFLLSGMDPATDGAG